MIVVGADAGGTRTRVALWRDGELLSRLEGLGAAIRPARVLQAATTIAGLAKSILARAGLTRADVLVVGAAGAGRTADAEELRAALRGEQIAERVVVTTDVALALASLPDGPAVLLLAGTGSVAIARQASGDTIRRGGHGWQMGDEGSGYWIGREALRAVGLAADARQAPTALSSDLLRATGSEELRDLVGWAQNAAPREVAALAAVVANAASGGDATAADILDRAADELASLAASLPRASTGPVFLGGGLLGDETFRRRVEQALAARDLEPAGTAVDPLEGAPRLAGQG